MGAIETAQYRIKELEQEVIRLTLANQAYKDIKIKPHRKVIRDTLEQAVAQLSREVVLHGCARDVILVSDIERYIEEIGQ